MKPEMITIDEQDFEIDPEIGEMLGLEGEQPEGSQPEQLGQIGRWMVGRQTCLDHLATPRPDCHCKDCNLGRQLQHVSDRKAMLEVLMYQRKHKVEDSITNLELMAKAVVDDMPTDGGQKPVVKIPGVGKFAYVKARATINTEGYDKWDGVQQMDAQRKYGNKLFDTTVKPNKNKIKVAEKEGFPIDECGFSVEKADDKFSFKPENNNMNDAGLDPCECCGEEAGQIMIGDETYRNCPNCGTGIEQ